MAHRRAAKLLPRGSDRLCRRAIDVARRIVDVDRQRAGSVLGAEPRGGKRFETLLIDVLAAGFALAVRAFLELPQSRLYVQQLALDLLDHGKVDLSLLLVGGCIGGMLIHRAELAPGAHTVRDVEIVCGPQVVAQRGQPIFLGVERRSDAFDLHGLIVPRSSTELSLGEVRRRLARRARLCKCGRHIEQGASIMSDGGGGGDGGGGDGGHSGGHSGAGHGTGHSAFAHSGSAQAAADQVSAAAVDALADLLGAGTDPNASEGGPDLGQLSVQELLDLLHTGFGTHEGTRLSGSPGIDWLRDRLPEYFGNMTDQEVRAALSGKDDVKVVGGRRVRAATLTEGAGDGATDASKTTTTGLPNGRRPPSARRRAPATDQAGRIVRPQHVPGIHGGLSNM